MTKLEAEFKEIETAILVSLIQLVITSYSTLSYIYSAIIIENLITILFSIDNIKFKFQLLK